MVAAASMNCQMEYSLIHARSFASSVRLCQEIDLAVERFPVGPVGVVVAPLARGPLADLVAEPDQLRAEPDELLRPRLRPGKIVAIVRRDVLLPGRHVGVELGQKFHDAGAVGGPVGGSADM
jgi:hypothetical protein